MSSTDLEYPQLLIDYRNAFCVSKTMFTACELGVFDLLHDAGEPLSAVAIASHLGTNADATERLLNACVGMKLLEKEVKNKKAYFSNMDISANYLVKSSPKSLYHMMMFFSHTSYKRMEFLPEAVREGKRQTNKAFGDTSTDLFKDVYRSEEELVTFMHFMDSVWKINGKDVIQAFDLSKFKVVYDLGGCSGGLAKEFLSTYPGSSVTIMDLPKVVQLSKKSFVTDPQISFHEGDFFNDALPEADLFIMAQIIHDWNEDKCMQLLKKVYKSCRPGGAVLVIEVLLDEDKSGPLTSLMNSLLMLIATDGTERTPSEFTKLLTDAGFRDVQFVVTGKLFNSILARK